jgi:hypothetical protein
MKNQWALLCLFGVSVLGAACDAPTAGASSESDAPNAHGAPPEPSPGLEPEGAAGDARDHAPCNPPELESLARTRPTEPVHHLLTAEEVGRYNEEEREKPPAPVLVEMPREVDSALVERQQDYLEAWRAEEPTREGASEAERESARAALKRRIVGQ